MHNNFIENLSELEIFFQNNIRFLTIFSNPISNYPGVNNFLRF